MGEISATLDLAKSTLQYWRDDNDNQMDELDWRAWLSAIAPEQVEAPMADAHVEFWDWIWSLQLGVGPSPFGFVALWPRGWGKSTSAELAVAALGARGRRRYALYVCATQGDADKHVASIAAVLESPAMARHYPAMSVRLTNKFGHSKGWSRTRLRTSSGFTVDALGLDSSGARGTRMGKYRPDLIVTDDIDALHDSEQIVAKHEATLTRSILKAGSQDRAVIFPQNLIHPGSVANRLYTREADWLADRIISGPFAAVDGLKYESTDIDDEGNIRWRITAGRANWEGMDLAACEADLNLVGPDAFIAEAQNDVSTRKGALWDQALLDAKRIPHVDHITAAGGLARIVVGVDPSVSDSPTADECGIVVAGKDYDGRGYVLEDRSVRAHPQEWARIVLELHRKYGSAPIVAEKNQGYELVRVNLRAMDPGVPVTLVQASKSKQARAQPVSTLYREGFVSHVGTFPILERQLTTWVPVESGGKSPDRLDALVYALAALFPATGVISEKELTDLRGTR